MQTIFAPMHGVPSLCEHCAHSEESHDDTARCPGPGLLLGTAPSLASG